MTLKINLNSIKPMKIYILFLSCFLFLSSSLISAQYGQLKVASLPGQEDVATLELYEGDTCELLLIDGVGQVKYDILIGEDLVEFEIRSKSSGAREICDELVAGPITLKLKNNGINQYGSYDPNYKRYAVLHYKLTRASDMEYRNMNIISIPEDTVGDGKQVVVESSSDLQTWTPVHSSSVSGDKAFFRTRIVNSGE